MTGSREAHLVELVDERGTAVGEATVSNAHQPPGRLHRAFSVLLVDPDGLILLQRRAPAKTRFPLRGEFQPGAPMNPDPAEVADLRWIGLAELRAGLTAEPHRYAPWLPGVVDLLASSDVVGRLTTDMGRSGGR